MAEDHDNGHREGAIEGDLNFPALTPQRSSRITSKKERITPVAASPVSSSTICVNPVLGRT